MRKTHLRLVESADKRVEREGRTVDGIEMHPDPAIEALMRVRVRQELAYYRRSARGRRIGHWCCKQLPALGLDAQQMFVESSCLAIARPDLSRQEVLAASVAKLRG